jgi:F0F1-type ATP synthase membrane subunit b/b'
MSDDLILTSSVLIVALSAVLVFVVSVVLYFRLQRKYNRIQADYLRATTESHKVLEEARIEAGQIRTRAHEDADRAIREQTEKIIREGGAQYQKIITDITAKAGQGIEETINKFAANSTSQVKELTSHLSGEIEEDREDIRKQLMDYEKQQEVLLKEKSEKVLRESIVRALGEDLPPEIHEKLLVKAVSEIEHELATHTAI